MSNIYIQEPPTSGKVLLKTTVGDIDIELWTKEAPKACRNFIQLCLEGYYNGTIFHRVVKGFIVQGGDPNGDGSGGESIYGAPFKDEFHSRLRFVRRGLVAMANAGKDDNGSQFFFTMGATPELQNKHTIFGKVTGETIYNMLKLEDGLVDHDERPQYPNKIIKAEVLINPFTDIVPRVFKPKEDSSKEKQKKEKKAGVKNFKLLSFGEEAEEDEELAVVANEKFAGKSKSTHDLLDDPKLSSVPAVSEEDKKREISEVEQHQEELENIRKKLKSGTSSKSNKGKAPSKFEKENENEEEEEEEEYYLGKDKVEENKKKVETIRKEIRDLKKNFQEEKKKRDEELEKSTKEQKKRSETLKEYDETIEKYSEKQKSLPKKGAAREEFTLQLLKRFQKKLDEAKEKAAEKGETQENINEDDEENEDDETWLAHKLSFDASVPVLARDANTKDDTWYDINDPRNPINKRRRDESKKLLSKKKSGRS